MSIKTHVRKSMYTELHDYCHFADMDSVIELTHWTSGEGFDVTITSKHESSRFSMTHGEFKALMVLANVEGVGGEA